MKHRRRVSIISIAMAAAASAGLTFSVMATAQNFPAKPITIVVGSSPGSTTDGLARTIAQEVIGATKQPVIVENKPGGGGGIAAQFVARAAPDGYTVFMTTNTTQAANPFLYKKLTYHPVKDFTPVAALVKGYLLMVVNPSVKAKNVSEFISMAKKEPGKYTFGSGSSSARVAAELFQQMTGVSMTHVPYKANPNAVVDLVSGQIDMMIVDLTTSLTHVRSGKLNALGVTSLQRSPLVPDLPTLNETGLPGYQISYWNGLYAPANTPEAVVKRLNELMLKAMQSEAVKKFVYQNGMEVFTSSPDELKAFQATELERWGTIIKSAGIQPE
ncbi:Bug family tripartite tricarboxylate transporter substrate binding protein [Noviherbaspirillum malthae]|uniref:Bug family tripartite tricarboxylate transporter substrate binding protein n=1 Tax=Noviherbaspirillum malthae TaxID=1260987 RepID=UPI00188F4537|nr:tripartite tricarboxylate transporter substrate binding protein [Noviherbaspirillum malthae]